MINFFNLNGQVGTGNQGSVAGQVAGQKECRCLQGSFLTYIRL